jgi:hypothetical protein
LRIAGEKAITIKDPANLVSSPCGSVLPSCRPPPFPLRHTNQREQISEEIQKLEDERWGDSPTDDFPVVIPFLFALTHRSKRSVRLGKELSWLRERALGLKEENRGYRCGRKRRKGRNGTARLGQRCFDTDSVTTTPHAGPTWINVAAVTVADMVKSRDLHNFLIQIANYACE